jgi:chaperonin GroES
MELKIDQLNVINDNVLVEAIVPVRRGGVVRGISTDDKPETGKVLKVGPGRVNDGGVLVQTGLAPGMTVLFNQHTTTKFNIEGKTYYTLRAEDVIAYSN